jgi:hypothetical protein
VFRARISHERHWRGARVGGRHHGEGRKTIRVALNRLMEPVIGAASVSRVLIENQALKSNML